MTEIKLSDYIRSSIKKIRTENKVKGIDICRDLKKHPSFISHIENGIVKTIELEDLKNVVDYILKVKGDGDDTDEFIDELLNKSDEESKDSSETQEEIFNLDEEYDTKADDLFEEIINNINDGFRFAFKKKRKYTFINLADFMKNLHFDLSFMLALISMPFYKLKDADVDIKKKMFSDISNTVKKYVKEYGKEDEDDSSKESE